MSPKGTLEYQQNTPEKTRSFGGVANGNVSYATSASGVESSARHGCVAQKREENRDVIHIVKRKEEFR